MSTLSKIPRMPQKQKRHSLWIMAMTVGLLLLVACSPSGSETAASGEDSSPAIGASNSVNTDADATAPEGEPAATEDESVAALTDTAVPPETAEESAAPETNMEAGIIVGDDRSDQLRSLTRSWNTNWELHTIDYDEILSGGPPRDGIPSIDEPKFISQDEASEWLAPNEPIVSVEIDGEARAYPLQILTWHEIVNDTVGDTPVAVTFCPLCNSALTFDRRFEGDTFEFGTSGLLRNSDLIMYDRTTETLWQQFTGEGIVGDLAAEQLTFVPSSIISFDDFRRAYPEGIVLSQDTGFSRRYGQNPYAGYDAIGNNPFLFDGDLDDRLPAMARVVTVSFDDTDVAYPYSVLAELGVINDSPGEHDLVVFFTPGTSSALGAPTIANAEDIGATGVFSPVVDGQTLTFELDGEKIVDTQTGSSWNIAGQAIDGTLAGSQLEPIVHGDHFWFSWAAFRPDTFIYN